MSKLKTPREKKLASLTRDCRNAHRENAKASRKCIPRNKQFSHQATRKLANQKTSEALLASNIDATAEVEADVRACQRLKELKAFRKGADTTLASKLHHQRTGYWLFDYQ